MTIAHKKLEPPLWAVDDQALVDRILEILEAEGSIQSASLVSTIKRHIEQVEEIGRLMDLYPSLFKTQTLGGMRRRNVDSLVQRLAKATPFTLELMLPMRAISGKTFLLARLNFMRLLAYVIGSRREAAEDATRLLAQVHSEISRCILARISEELLMAVVCRNDLEPETRQRAAQGLTHLWEDRIHFPMREFFPVLEATWEARRRILVTYGTLAGTEEMFRLMAEGCDDRFVSYFLKENLPEDAVLAFREFIFGLSTEELGRLETKKLAEGLAVISHNDVMQALAPESLTVISPEDVASQLYLFFMKRHLEATARSIGNLPGPKHTAEEYVLLEFLADHDPEIFGE